MKPILLVGEAQGEAEAKINWYELDRAEKLRLVKLHCANGLSSKEIGAILGCPARGHNKERTRGENGQFID